MSKKNRFDAMLQKSNDANKEYLSGDDSPLAKTAENLEAEENAEKTGVIEHEELVKVVETEKKESASKKVDKSTGSKVESKVDISRFVTNKRERRCVKKAFLLTQSNADYIDNIAKQTGNSVNEIINQILEMQRQG